MDRATVRRLLCLAALACTLLPSLALTEGLEKKVADKVIESNFLLGVEQRLCKAGELKNTLSRTELLSSQELKDKQAFSLTNALQAALDVRVFNECFMCGAKRVVINNFKGEHTNVLFKKEIWYSTIFESKFTAHRVIKKRLG